GSGASERARSFALSMALIRSDDNSSMIRLKICLLFLLFCVLQIASLSRAQSIPSTPWPATDALGRQVPVAQEVGQPRPDRFVGIFYFLWHSQRPGENVAGQGPRDISKILAQDPDALHQPESPLCGR